MVKSLVAFGWLRDMGIVLFLLAGNDIQHTSPSVGIMIMVGALGVFLERFVWSWYLVDLQETERRTS
jgi:hypothetical protein